MKSYQEILSFLLEQGEEHRDRTGVGTYSTFGYQWRHSMKDGFPLLTTKKVPFRWVAEELFWFLSGSTKESDLRDRGVDIWREWSTEEQCARFGREEGDLGPVYGRLWRDYPVGNAGEDDYPLFVDQIKQLYDDLLVSPNSRRLIVTGWHPHYQKRVALPPCHTLFQLKVHSDNSLSLNLYARSIDSFLGLPFNIASYALLLSLFAFTTNREPRDLVILFGDLHLYTNHVEQARIQITREAYPLPKLEINERLRGAGFEGLLSATYEDLKMVGYRHHPKIEAEVAV